MHPCALEPYLAAGDGGVSCSCLQRTGDSTTSWKRPCGSIRGLEKSRGTQRYRAVARNGGQPSMLCLCPAGSTESQLAATHCECNGGGKQGGSRVWVGNAGPMLLLGRALKASAAFGYSRTASGRAPPRHFPSSLSDRARRSSYTRNRTVRSEVKAPSQGTAECSLPAHELRPGNARGRWGNMGFRGHCTPPRKPFDTNARKHDRILQRTHMLQHSMFAARCNIVKKT